MTEKPLTNCEAELERWKAVAVGAVKDTERVIEDCDRLRDRLAALEAPPVVPMGWAVCQWKDPGSPAERWHWIHVGNALDVPPAAVYRAHAWAIEHDARPPHEGDKP